MGQAGGLDLPYGPIPEGELGLSPQDRRHIRQEANSYVMH